LLLIKQEIYDRFLGLVESKLRVALIFGMEALGRLEGSIHS